MFCPNSSRQSLFVCLAFFGMMVIPRANAFGQVEAAQDPFGQLEYSLPGENLVANPTPPTYDVADGSGRNKKDKYKFLFTNGDRHHLQRHVGLGEPLVGTSWLNRPVHFDGFVGGLFGDELDNGVSQRGAVFRGVRLGWDFDNYWGLESRFGFSDPFLSGAPGKAEVQFFDVNLMYYPWGDSRWRPFAGVGAGIARYTFANANGAAIQQTSLHLPIGGGVKYYLHKSVAIRIELFDNIAIGKTDLPTVNNFSLTGGLEWRFGGRRRVFFPFDSDVRPW